MLLILTKSTASLWWGNSEFNTGFCVIKHWVGRCCFDGKSVWPTTWTGPNVAKWLKWWDMIVDWLLGRLKNWIQIRGTVRLILTKDLSMEDVCNKMAQQNLRCEQKIGRSCSDISARLLEESCFGQSSGWCWYFYPLVCPRKEVPKSWMKKSVFA